MRPKKEINIRVGENIQCTREKAGYTQEKLAEILDITPNHLSAIERGASGATLETIEKLCLLFGISADALVFGNIRVDDWSLVLAAQLDRASPQYRPYIQRMVTALLEMLDGRETDDEDL